jgi:hypothetical protein
MQQIKYGEYVLKINVLKINAANGKALILKSKPQDDRVGSTVSGFRIKTNRNCG